MMLRITGPCEDEREWKLIRHITSPDQQGTCEGLPREFAPPEEHSDPGNLPTEPKRRLVKVGDYPHGVFEDVLAARPTFYYDFRHDKVRYRCGGFRTAYAAALAHDRCCIALNIRFARRNFPELEE